MPQVFEHKGQQLRLLNFEEWSRRNPPMPREPLKRYHRRYRVQTVDDCRRWFYWHGLSQSDGVDAGLAWLKHINEEEDE